jgi:putative redox protein
MDLEADSTSEHPIVYHTIRFNFFFEGENLPADKIVKAVSLSTERYCGVNAMLQKSANVLVKTFINSKEV